MHVQSVCCAHTPAIQSTVLQVYSDSASYPDFIRDSTGSKSGFRSEPPIAPSTHVPSCHIPRGPSTVSNLVLHTAYCAYCLTTRTVHVATHVVSHNDPVVVQCTDDVKTDSIQCPMHVYELPQFLFYINTPLGDDGCNNSISVLSPLPLIPGVQRIRSMPHTRAVQSSSCAGGSVLSAGLKPDLYP